MIVDCGKSQGYVAVQQQTVTGNPVDVPTPVAVIYWIPNQPQSYCEVMSRSQFSEWLDRNASANFQHEVHYVKPENFKRFNQALVRHKIREVDIHGIEALYAAVTEASKKKRVWVH